MATLRSALAMLCRRGCVSNASSAPTSLHAGRDLENNQGLATFLNRGYGMGKPKETVLDETESWEYSAYVVATWSGDCVKKAVKGDQAIVLITAVGCVTSDIAVHPMVYHSDSRPQRLWGNDGGGNIVYNASPPVNAQACMITQA
ncbi:hypothetical protein ACP4OV_031495 [Aristida adscensionis]